MPSRSIVLCYHAVSDTWPDPLAVRPHDLERQLRSLLRRGYAAATLAEVAGGARGVAHATFDDAYRSILTAVPLLERLAVRATVFVCPALAESGAPLAVPELGREVQLHPEELATLTWDDLRALGERGFEIGSHTLTHAHLTRLGDAELRRELVESRARCEDELRRACRFLAYPYGEHDARVREAARAAGYEAAVTLGARGGGVFALPRVDLYRDDGPLVTALKTSALRGPLRAAARLHRSRRRRRDGG